MRNSSRRALPGSVRIIGGRWRSRRLALVADSDVRPTPDRVRETLFNWLAPTIAGAACLDLYAGSGALGFEALSRGARHVCFVERDASLAAALARHAATLGVERDEATIENVAVERFLARSGTRRFDIVFLDPPYAQELEPLLGRLGPWLAEGARIYVERAATREGLAAALGSAVELLKQARAGSVSYGLARLPPSP